MIGFFGGSFDPVHFGHLKNATTLKKQLNLSALFLMPCAAPVHKNALNFSNAQRLEMLQLATQVFDELSIDLREINRDSASYTIESLIDIKCEYADTPICLIVGMDSFINLHTWKDYQDFHQYVHLVVMARPNHQALEVSHAFTRTKNINELHNQTSGLLYFADTELLNISSSEIRGILFNAASSGKIGAQQSLSGLLPDPIIHYLQHL
ncbi:MAG TPA: nicotinate (nicotinamide) nucleotide adenylyltransferase [Gammaproteobacteria bacterium]|nr:nicotinate (nicotinamide) nucleotide adenylyltransferase [Gammaproteobacteria bacterium]